MEVHFNQKNNMFQANLNQIPKHFVKHKVWIEEAFPTTTKLTHH